MVAPPPATHADARSSLLRPLRRRRAASKRGAPNPFARGARVLVEAQGIAGGDALNIDNHWDFNVFAADFHCTELELNVCVIGIGRRRDVPEWRQHFWRELRSHLPILVLDGTWCKARGYEHTHVYPLGGMLEHNPRLQVGRVLLGNSKMGRYRDQHQLVLPNRVLSDDAAIGREKHDELKVLQSSSGLTMQTVQRNLHLCNAKVGQVIGVLLEFCIPIVSAVLNNSTDYTGNLKGVG